MLLTKQLKAAGVEASPTWPQVVETLTVQWAAHFLDPEAFPSDSGT